MRTVALAVVCLLVAAPPIPAQDAPTSWAAKLFRTEDGKVPSGHNFGTVPKGALLQHRFPITNIYAVPLTITTRVSCGCVTATPNPQVLQPRQTGWLDVTMDTNRFTGQKQVNVDVTVSHPQFWSTATLVIQGFCRGDVELAPATAVFGVVPVGRGAARDVTVRYHGMKPWQIIGLAEGEAAPFDVQYQEAYRQVGQVGYRVSLTLKPAAAAGSYKGDLLLRTNDENNPFVAVPYDVTVQAPLTVTPSVISGTATVGKDPLQKTVIIRAAQAFRILGIDGQGDGVTAQPSRPDAVPAQVVTIRLEPTQPGPVRKTLTVRTDLAGGATAMIKVDVTAVAQ